MAGIKSRLDKPKLSKNLVKASLFCAQTPPSPGSRKLMKNQAILFTVVLLAFGSKSVSAQRTMGYVNTALGPGFSLIYNPLVGPDNSIAALFKNVTPVVPDKLSVFLLGPSGYEKVTYDSGSTSFSPPDLANQTLLPGRGVFVFNPTSSFLTVTFV